MKPENIEKIAKNLCLSKKNSASSGSTPSHRINLPYYQGIYFAIFFDDLNENGRPTSADAFIDALAERITNEGNKIDEFDEELEIFQKTWNDWVYLYRELVRRGLLKS